MFMFCRYWEKEIEAEWEKEEREDKGKPQRPKIQLSIYKLFDNNNNNK